jgi:type II secretory pathway pseudopilin PulG
MKIHSQSRKSRGFTLIEVVIALGLMLALIILCARLATADIQLANGISRKQAENTLRESFFEMMKFQLGSLPGNTRMELKTSSGGQPYLYELTLQNVPLAFTWGGVEKVAKAVQIVGVKRRDGFINVVMRYYENEILNDQENLVSAQGEEPFAEVILMEEVRFFEWRALDGRTMEWQLDWDLQGRLPLQLELVTAQGAYGDEMKQIFWIVPKVSPLTVIRSMGQGQPQTGNPGGGIPEGGGGGGTVIPGGGIPGGGGGPKGGGGGPGGKQ